MGDVSLRLRRWLQSLDDADLGVIISICKPAGMSVQVCPPQEWLDRRALPDRELRTARVWLAKATSAQLNHLACSAIDGVAGILETSHGFDRAVVRNPDREQLGRLLTAVGLPVGRLVLFGLLLSQATASELAIRHGSDLERELENAEHKFPTEWSTQPPLEFEPAELATLANRLDELKYKSAGFREHAIDAAQRVGNGQPIGPHLAMLDEYETLRTAVAEEFAKVCDTSAGDFAELDQALAMLRARLDDRQRHERIVKADQIDKLEKQLDGLTMALRNATDDDVRAQYEDMIRRAEARLASLDPARGQPVPAGQAEPLVNPPASVSVVQNSPVDWPAEAADENEPSQRLDLAEAACDASPTEALFDQSTASFEPAANESIEPTSGSASDAAIGPWEEGSPPLAVSLVSQGRLTEAYWVTSMSAEPDHRTAVLRFAAAAYGTHTPPAFDIDPSVFDDDPEAAVVALTAALRCGLVSGWWPTQPAKLRSALQLPDDWSEFVDAAVAAVQHGHRVTTGIGSRTVPGTSTFDVDSLRAELGSRAANLMAELPRRKTQYQRASKVLLRLAGTGGPLYTALQTVVTWAKDGVDRQALCELAACFEQDAVHTMIADADAAATSAKRAKEPIVAGAHRALVRAVGEVADIVYDATELAGRTGVPASDDTAAAAALAKALATLNGASALAGMTGAALDLLRRWLLDPSTVTEHTVAYFGVAPLSGRGLPEPGPEVLLPLHDLPRLPDGRPDPGHPQVAEALARLREPLDLGLAIRAYCERGDLRRARRILELHATRYWPFATGADAGRDTLDRAVEKWSKEYQTNYQNINDLFARIRTQNLLDQSLEVRISGKLQALAPPVGDAVDEKLAELRQLADELTGHERSRLAELRTELDGRAVDDADRKRIHALLDEGDTITAAEFLAFIRAGKRLPEQPAESSEDLQNFVAFLAQGTSEIDASTSALAWARLATGDRGLVGNAMKGLKAWDDLTREGRTRNVAELVQDILGTLGLTSSVAPREQTRGVRSSQPGFRQFRVQGSPADGSYVAALGSDAPEFAVTVIFEERRGRPVLDVLGEQDAAMANIVLYRHPLDISGRRQLLSKPDGRVNALVIDPAAMGWVAAMAPGSWRATQRITLPWTSFNPYTPFVAGLVPPEVFYGRQQQMAEVADPYGGLFVYGGRQLGKSALLRRVERTFPGTDPRSRHAIYLDLKGKGIGEAEPADRIWRELAFALKERGVIDAKDANQVGIDAFTETVRRWLLANQARRILVLADEADAFLTADSRSVATPAGMSQFQNVSRLKELMESTGRRFKIVFAGLHQVQRFVHLANVPLVHGGPDIPVGPLNPPDARLLVVEPMAALGYRFERAELVWRLLSATNYQASLIQIFCDELVRTLHRRKATAADYSATITGDDVDSVAGSDTVRRLIAERLRITINLDDRYRVLTLLIAWCSLLDSFRSDYTPQVLLDFARDAWPAGFEELDVSDVRIYLDEMVALGLLIQVSGSGGGYAMRSPNVVNMLGTVGDLEAELDPNEFDRPYEYNPREARRLLFSDQEGERRSPLTDGQLSTIIESGAVCLVCGTPALGIDRVEHAIGEYAEIRECRLAVVRTADEASRVGAQKPPKGKRLVVVADLRSRPPDEIPRVWRHLAERTKNTSTASVVLTGCGNSTTVLAHINVEPTQLHRWTSDSVRSWPECPFTVPADRRRLIEATGGWPVLVERAIAGVVQHGWTREDALRRIEDLTTDPQKAARLLTQAGLDDGLIRRIRPWIDYVDIGDQASRQDILDVFQDDAAGADTLLRELDLMALWDHSNDGTRLDLVIHRCLRTVCGG
jgi:hypothetical protein